MKPAYPNACGRCSAAKNQHRNRAVLHVALRSTNSPIVVDGEDVMPKVNQSSNAWANSHEVRSGSWLGYTNQVITDIVSIGIGGSDSAR